MKCVFTFLCALVLLVTSFSGVLASAAEMSAAAVTEIVTEAPAVETIVEETTAEEPATEAAAADLEEVELEPISMSLVASSDAMPVNYKAPYEEELGAGFVSYLQGYISQIAYEIPVSQYNLPTSAFESITNIIFYESPELFGPCQIGGTASGGIITKLYMKEYREFSNTPQEYATCLAAIREARDYLVRGVKGNNKLTDVEKALILHDRLAVWNEYDLGIYLYSGYEKYEIYTAVGPLMNQSGVCQGIAQAYIYLLEEVGVKSDMVLSSALNHAWNIVYVQGSSFHVDVTWDDETNYNGYSLTNTYYDTYGRVNHDNFLLSSDGIWNSGHKAYDYNTTPNDTRYDSYDYVNGTTWWMDTVTAVQLVGDKLYFQEKEYGEIDCATDGRIIHAYENYSSTTHKLASANGKLLCSTAKNVEIVDPETREFSVLYAPASIQYTNGYIEGLKYEKDKIWVQLNDGYGNSWRESMDYKEVGEAVKIVTQPTNAAAPNGSKAKVTVKATGDGLTYTWYHKNRNSTDYSVSSVTTATYSVKMSSTTHGRYVYCVITDAYGNSVKTNVVRVYMGNPAKITTQPTNAAAPKGSAAKVTVKASGDGLTYTWYHKSANSSKYSKSSVTSATYSVKTSSTVHGRYVYCVIKDKYGISVKTNVVRVYMGTPVKITTQPTNAAAPKGSAAKITVKASGSGLTYTWYHKSANSSKYSKSSVTSATYSVKTSSTVHGRYVYCVVKDKYGVTAKTNVVRVYMGNPAKITTQPTNAAAPNGKTIKVTLKASGDSVKYTWYTMKKGASKYTKSSITSASFSTKMAKSWNGAKVYCVVKDKYGISVKSSVVTLYTGTPAKITTQPKNTAKFANEKVKLTVKASGSGLKYAWYHMRQDATKYSKSTSMTGKTFSIKMTSAWDGAKVYCVVTDKYGVPVKSSVVTLTLKQKAKITGQPANASGLNGETVKTSVKATGDGLTYTWYYAKKGSSKFTKTSVKTATYSVKMSSSVNGRKVYCVVKDKYGNSVKTKTVTLSMIKFDPVNSITGNWYSYAAYTSYSGYEYFYSAEMTVYSSGKVSVYIEYGNGLFTYGNFTYYFDYEGISGDDAYYYLYNNAGELTGIYNISDKTFCIMLNSGSYIMFER